MYLLIGHPDDACCGLVAAALRAAGHTVWITLNPLAGEGICTWNLTTTTSSSVVRPGDGPTIESAALRGVLVRAPGGIAAGDGWSERDLAYVRAETNAALVAWLRALPCRVINRPDAELWFRPQRPLPEWQALLARCGLPVLATTITNDPAAARRFAARWGDQAVYAPLTSLTRYPLHDESAWRELDKVMARVPVCLLEPTHGPALWALVAGTEVLWSDPTVLSATQRAAWEEGLRTLAGQLGLDLLQIELRQSATGPRCSNLMLYPLLEAFAPESVARLATILTQWLTA